MVESLWRIAEIRVYINTYIRSRKFKPLDEENSNG